MSASVRQYKAPYRYARKGRTLVLMERGNATGQTFSSEAAAKRTVLEMNDAWRAQGAKKANPRHRANPYFGNGLLHDDDVFLDLQAIWKRGISPDVKPYRLRNYTERQTKKFYAQYGSGILNNAADYEMAVADWARTYPPTELMKKANPRKYDESKDGAGYRKLSDLKKGEFFKRKADARKVYRKGDYDRTDRKYTGKDESDISRTIYLKGDTLVYVGFDY